MNVPPAVSQATCPGRARMGPEGGHILVPSSRRLCVSAPPPPASSPSQLLESFLPIVLCDQICKLLSKLLVTF